jgi:hypothetical protein
VACLSAAIVKQRLGPAQNYRDSQSASPLPVRFETATAPMNFCVISLKPFFALQKNPSVEILSY